MIGERELIEFITAQRWFGSKTREVVHARVIDSALLRNVEPRCAIELVEVAFDTGLHETYQLLRVLDAVGIDGLSDPGLARELARAMRAGLTLQGEHGVLEFRPVEGFDGLAVELKEARPIEAEQSNSSIVFDDEVILKVFRRLEAGINPELELVRFLTEHDFENIAALGGWYSYAGEPMDATLGVLQRFIQGGEDGWDLALAELGKAPERFIGRLRRLGEVTGTMHSILGSDPTDPHFSPEVPSVEALGLLSATIDEQIERIFLELPADNEALSPIRGRGEEVRERLRLLTHIGPVGRVIRHHGDFHLGQTLWAQGDWVILDFEGEPARSLTERRRKRSPLRDVAGMLRSFAYAASASELLRGVPAPEGWERRARAEFLAGYGETIDRSLLPGGEEAKVRLLSVFELEKAVYELRYELDTRPDWVGIPVAGILRLLEEAAPE